ncbi:hypothetical protein MBLNU459_g0688t2 [Dothideomycetes sp. NU459]
MDASTDVIQHVGYTDSLNVAISICLTKYGLDDLFVGIATLMTLIHFGTSYATLADGMGKPAIILLVSFGRLNTSAVAGVVTFILSLYLSKITALVFMLRIASVKKTVIIYHACIAVTALFGIASLLAVTVDSPTQSGYYWDLAGNHARYPSQHTRWQLMTALDVVSEIALLFLPVHLVWSLQMKTQKKIVVVATFWTRIPTIVLSFVREHYVGRLLRPSVDPSLGSAIVLILMDVELTYTLVSCTISTSKNFTDLFNTGWGMGPIRGAAETYNMSNMGTNGSSGLRTGKGDTVDTNASSSQPGQGERRPTATEKRQSQSAQAERRSRKNSTANGLAQTEEALQLRPDAQSRTHTMVQSTPRQWSDGGSLDSDPDDTAIVRHTEYSITHDEAPILPRPTGRRR